MTLPPAPSAAAVDEAITRGLDWLERQIDPRGCIHGSAEAVVYYKSPAILALAGRRGTAARVLAWIERHFLGQAGELVLPAEQEQRNPFNAYDRGWLCLGAHLV